MRHGIEPSVDRYPYRTTVVLYSDYASVVCRLEVDVPIADQERAGQIDRPAPRKVQKHARGWFPAHAGTGIGTISNRRVMWTIGKVINMGADSSELPIHPLVQLRNGAFRV
jgi:hypothetical protein